jgi:hypothetical protein
MLPALYFFKYFYCFHNFKSNNFPAPRMARCGGKCGAKKIAYNSPSTPFFYLSYTLLLTRLHITLPLAAITAKGSLYFMALNSNMHLSGFVQPSCRKPPGR